MADPDVREADGSRFEPITVNNRQGVYQEVMWAVRTGKVPVGAAPTELPTAIVGKRVSTGNTRSATKDVSCEATPPPVTTTVTTVAGTAGAVTDAGGAKLGAVTGAAERTFGGGPTATAGTSPDF